MLKQVLLSLFILFLITPVSAQVEQIRVACVGNSITEGAGMGTNTYPDQLGRLLGDHYDVYNFGLGGRTLLKKGDFPYWDENFLYDAKELNPQIVIILLGTNDSKPQNWVYKNEFYSDYMDLVAEFRLNGWNPQIYTCFPPPVFQDGAGITDSIIHDEIIPLIDSVLQTANTYLIDFNEGMAGQSSHFPDGIHPDADGYGMMAEIARDSILHSPSGIIRYFNVYPSVFEQGQDVKLFWETTAGTEVIIDGNVYSETDSLTVSPEGNTTYSLIASGEVSDTAFFTVEYLAPGNVKSFYADPPFLEKGAGESSMLHWTTSIGSEAALDGTTVQPDDSLLVTPDSTTTYVLAASGEDEDSRSVTVQVLDAEEINRSLLKKEVKVSTTARGYQAEFAVDGDASTAWKSGGGGTQWFFIDLGKTIYLSRVVLNWGETYGINYRIEAVNEASAVSIAYSTTDGDGEIDDLTELSGAAKYLRLLALSSNNPDSGYVLNEFEVYGYSSPTGVEETGDISPTEFRLEQNYPNPFNPSTAISYQLSANSHVSLKVYDVLGNEIATLVNKEKPAGSYEVVFDANELPSGIYFYRLSAGSFGKAGSYSQTKKMILLR